MLLEEVVLNPEFMCQWCGDDDLKDAWLAWTRGSKRRGRRRWPRLPQGLWGTTARERGRWAPFNSSKRLKAE
jgi:hypothetical protein